MGWFAYASIAAVIVSITILVEKRLLQKHYVMDFLFGLLLLSSILFWLALGAPLDIYIPPHLIALCIIEAFIGAVVLSLSDKALKIFEVSTASPLLAVSAVLTVILSIFFLNETFTLLKVVGVLFLLGGILGLEVAALGFKGLSSIQWDTKKVAILVGAILFGALPGIFDKYLLSVGNIEPNSYLLVINFLQTGWIFILGSLWYRRPLSLVHIFKTGGPGILLVAVLTVLQRYFFVQALAVGALSLVILVKRSSILITTLVGGEIFLEHRVWPKFAAAVSIFIGIFFILK